jgi:ABC-type multidrug transport system fused ATPase/permease subunit
LKNPPILVLDEPTSALDTESEDAVQSAIEPLTHGREGRVIESGMHWDLVKQGG